jgi:uncharacterized protein (UPF0332 family)
MKDSSRQLLEKSARAILAAERLREDELYEFSTGRAYYAMFYATEALLNERELRFSKHGGVHGSFGEHFVKTGLFDQKYHRWLLDAFDQRIEGDYGVEGTADPADAAELISHAREFLQAVKVFLGVLF